MPANVPDPNPPKKIRIHAPSSTWRTLSRLRSEHAQCKSPVLVSFHFISFPGSIPAFITCRIYPFPSTLRMRALRANVIIVRSKVARSQQPLLAQQTPVLFPQPTILALGQCQRLLNRFLYGHLHMKQQPRYAFSTVNRTIGRVALCKQFIECRVRSTAIKHTSGHVAF